MNKYTFIAVYTTIFCFIEFVMVKYGKFAFGGVIAMFLFFGFMTSIMGHKDLGRSSYLGTIIFAIILLFFGWTFMKGWLSPEEFMKAKK